MSLHAFQFVIPGLFLTVSTTLVGGSFVVLAWFKAAYDQLTGSERIPRKALCVFTASLLPYLFWWLFSWAYPPRVEWVLAHERLNSLSFLSGPIASFPLVIVSMVLAYRNPGRIVRIGSSVLFAINIVGLIWLILDLFGVTS